MALNAKIITIGDEILIGKTLDTNSHWIANQLTLLGFLVTETITISDNEESIFTHISDSFSLNDLTIVTGGLGPTKDDITKTTLCKIFDTELEWNKQRLEELEQFYQSRGRELNELNKTQALQPKTSIQLTNQVGTANGILFNKNGKIVISLPGVPHEMRHILETAGFDYLRNNFQLPAVVYTEIKTVGIPESDLALKLDSFEKELPKDIKLAYLPSLSLVKLRLTTHAKSTNEGLERLNIQVGKLKQIIPKHIYGKNSESLEQAIGELLQLQKLSISTAESCTGGKIASQITSIAGSSKYYWGSIIAYQNEIKTKQLGVAAEIISEHGAVSKETVEAMALGIRDKLGSSIGIATSGIAGPSGGSPEKPVGTVWIALSSEKGVYSKKLQLMKDRAINIRLSTNQSLYFLWQYLKGYLDHDSSKEDSVS